MARHSSDPRVEALVDADPEVQAADARVAAALAAAMNGSGRVEDYSAALLEWVQARRRARARYGGAPSATLAAADIPGAVPTPTVAAPGPIPAPALPDTAPDQLLDAELDGTFPASDPLPGPAALT